MRDIIILASGPSVKEYNLRGLEERGTLIAVSAAGIYTKPHIALTMDRRAAEHCYPLWCVQGVPRIFLRACTIKNIQPSKNVQLFQHDDVDTKMTDARGALNGSNSGTCAVNLAYQMRPDRVFLVGFDMQRDDVGAPYWHYPYPWSTCGAVRDGTYASWAKEFDIIAAAFRERAINVYNVNHRSLIEAFPKITYEQFLGMTS